LVHQWTDFGGAVEWVSHRECTGGGRETLREFFKHAALHDQPVGAHAGLARVAELAGHGLAGSLVKVCVLEHYEWRVPTKFQADALHRVRRLAVEDLADLGTAGEGELADAVVADYHFTDGARTLRGQHLQRAGFAARLQPQFRQPERCQWRL